MSDFHPTTYETAMATPATGVERLAAVASHGALMLGLPLLLPALIYFCYPLVQPPSAYVRHQAWQALLFHALVLVVSGILWGLAAILFSIILLGWPFAIVVAAAGVIFGVWSIVIMVIATVKAFMGQPYRLPVIGDWSEGR